MNLGPYGVRCTRVQLIGPNCHVCKRVTELAPSPWSELLLRLMGKETLVAVACSNANRMKQVEFSMNLGPCAVCAAPKSC